MSSTTDLMQFIFAGLTNGAIYALVALGFGVVHNTMSIVNFTQVDFVSLGGMLLYSALFAAGLLMLPAQGTAILGVTMVAMAVEWFGLRPSRSQNTLVLIFLTIGISIILRGLMKLVWGKNRLAVPPLTGEEPVRCLGAAILPQTLWILVLTALAIVALITLLPHYLEFLAAYFDLIHGAILVLILLFLLQGFITGLVDLVRLRLARRRLEQAK